MILCKVVTDHVMISQLPYIFLHHERKLWALMPPAQAVRPTAAPVRRIRRGRHWCCGTICQLSGVQFHMHDIQNHIVQGAEGCRDAL